MSNQQFLDALMGRYGPQQVTTIDPASPEDTSAPRLTLTRGDLVSRLTAATMTKGQAVRATDSDEVGQAGCDPIGDRK